MAVYAISDIHGHYAEFQAMLDKIGLTGTDQLYILGDIVDHGRDSAEMLIWAIEDAPSNVHFLLGNHEDMMREVVEHNPSWLQQRRNKTLWTMNGGVSTARKVKRATTGEWRRESLLPWLQSLPPYAFAKIGSREVLLVHAGLSIGAMRAFRDSKPYKHLDVRAESNALELHTMPPKVPVYDLGHGIGEQGRDELLWVRGEWLYAVDRVPCEVVHGHTTLDSADIARMEMAGGRTINWKPGRICHYFGNRHDIDCGASMNEKPYALGCLRLDDLGEFYVPLR